MHQGESVSVTVAEAVAEREGTDPTALQPPLHAVVDTDALDALFRSTASTARTDGTVAFQYKGYQIRIDSSGEVRIGQTDSFSERPDSRTEFAEDAVSD